MLGVSSRILSETAWVDVWAGGGNGGTRFIAIKCLSGPAVAVDFQRDGLRGDFLDPRAGGV